MRVRRSPGVKQPKNVHKLYLVMSSNNSSPNAHNLPPNSPPENAFNQQQSNSQEPTASPPGNP